MKRRSSRLGATVLALALLAAACGGDETTEAGSSPLAEFLGQDFDFDSEDAQARFADEERERQETIVACMKREGFDYIPVDTSSFNFVETSDGLEYDSREYAEKYGFGFSTQRFSQEEVGPDLVGHSFDQESAEDGPNDPNQEIVDAMDDSTRDAYYEALYGSQDDFPAFDETMSEEELAEAESGFEWEPSGCEGEAYSEDPTNAFYQEFEDELEELYSAVQDDARIIEAQQEITDCVSEKGYELGSGSDFFESMFEDIESQMSEIDQMMGGFPGEDLTEEDFASMTEEELDELFNQPRNLPPEALTLLGEIQERETGMAVAMFDCGGGSFGGNRDLYEEVQAEYEEKFLQDHSDRLEEFKQDA